MPSTETKLILSCLGNKFELDNCKLKRRNDNLCNYRQIYRSKVTVMKQFSKAEFSVMLLVCTLFLSVIVIYFQSQRATDNAVKQAFSNAKAFSDLEMHVMQNYLESISGISTSDLSEYPNFETDKAWFPAVFSKKYSEDYSNANPNVKFKIFSLDPFLSNRDRVLDDFGKAALGEFLSAGSSSFRRVEQLGGGIQNVRFARPYIMEEKCVACHNQERWGLQKQDWKVGDIRGAWEVSIVVHPVSLATQSELFGLLAIVVVACILGVGVALPAVRREVQYGYTMEKQVALKALEAQTDPLTQIGNRRFFDAVFTQLFNEKSRENGKLCLLYTSDAADE